MSRTRVARDRRYAFLLGEDISHSLSPVIQNAAFAALGLSYEYSLLNVPRAWLQDALARMRQPDCLGGNITMPYKSAVLAAAEECSDAVHRCGAASVLVNRGGRFVLENNDLVAITACLRRRAATVAKGPAVIIGAGGSAAAMLEAFRQVPPTRVLVLARRPERAAALVERVRGWLPVPIEAGPLGEGGSAMAEATLILNATHLGVHPGDPSPVPRQVLRPGLLIYDIVYSRNGLNRLQSDALSAGALVCDGLAHLLEQAPITFRMLTGHEAPRELMRASLIAATGHRPLDWGSDSTDGTRQRGSEESFPMAPSR